MVKITFVRLRVAIQDIEHIAGMNTPIHTKKKSLRLNRIFNQLNNRLKQPNAEARKAKKESNTLTKISFSKVIWTTKISWPF